MDVEELKQNINSALDILYNKDGFLIKEGLCERCIGHRFAICLELQGFGDGYFVDCEYNKSHIRGITESKKISSINGNYIDIVITKRDGNISNDLVCFELKRWNNYDGRKKDRDNLEVLTGKQSVVGGGIFGYDYGVCVIFGKKRGGTKISIYINGNLNTVC